MNIYVDIIFIINLKITFSVMIIFYLLFKDHKQNIIFYL